PGLLANQKSKPWRGDRDAGVLENVAICVPPRGSGFPRKPITGVGTVGTPGYCLPRLQLSGPHPPPSLLSAASGG
ncbi:MAG: hypothetical protein ACK56W_12640, partial [Pirellula sp.]